jgi:hypothetical protein
MPSARPGGSRSTATGTGCRSGSSRRRARRRPARRAAPSSPRDTAAGWRALRALQLAYFTSDLLLDDPEGLRRALETVGAGDAVDRLEDEAVLEAYARDRAEARSAAGTPAEAQGKASTSDGPVRYTAPSVVFERDGTRLVAGGWQPLLAYDVLLANLDPSLRRTPAPAAPGPLLDHFPEGLTTAEVAALLADGADPVPDLGGARRALEEAGARRAPLGQDGLWTTS